MLVSAWTASASALEPTVGDDAALQATSAQPDPAESSQLFFGAYAVGEALTTARVDDVPRNEDWGLGQLNYAFSVGYDGRISRGYCLGMLARTSSWDSAWSSAAGYTRRQHDLSLVPRVYSRLKRRRLPTKLYVGLPFGLTFASIETPRHQAFEERIGPGLGYNLGVLIGVALFGRRLGGFVELAVLLRGVSFDATYLPAAPDSEPWGAHLHYATTQLLLGGGMLTGF